MEASAKAADDAAADVNTVRLFASYSPAEVVLRFKRDPAPLVAPEREDFNAAIGFVDVSGFTALSEKLQKQFGFRRGCQWSIRPSDQG